MAGFASGKETMKKRLSILITLMLVFTFLLTACGKSEPTEENNTINLPVVEGGQDVVNEPEVAPVTPTEEPVAPIQETYPIGEDQASTNFDPSLAYPIDPASPNYDAEMEAFLTNLIGQKHSLQFLYEKDLTAEQWREILVNADHTHLQLTEGSLIAIIDWLMTK
jgi:uncharacterized lipoprotein YehR (DUF1307 family)